LLIWQIKQFRKIALVLIFKISATKAKYFGWKDLLCIQQNPARLPQSGQALKNDLALNKQ